MNLTNLIYEYLYPVTVTVLFLSIWFYFRFMLNRMERRKLRKIKKRDINDAIETDSPVENQEQELKDKGIHLTEGKFSFLHKMFPILMIPLWLLIIFIPYLGRLPSVYISIVAAVFSVVIGVALRPFLENLFSGVVISFFKSISIGDTVEIDGNYGLIEEIGLTYTVLKRWDWSRIVIPNTKLLQKEIENLTMSDSYIWAHVEFYVEPDADIKIVEELAINSAKGSKYFQGAEDPSFWVMGIKNDAIKCWVAAWADNPSDAWELKHEIRSNIITSLRSKNIRFHQFNFSNFTQDNKQ